MEADLQRFYTVDYGDHFRRDDRGRRRLSLRRIFVLIRHLPAESVCAAIARDHKPHWSVEAHLLDNVYMALTSSKQHPAKPHPDRPTRSSTAVLDPDRARKLAAARRRRAERARKIEAGEIP